MIPEYKAFLDAFKMGKEVVNAVKVKNFTMLGNSVGALLIALSTISQAFGYHIPLDNSTLTQVGTGVANVWLLWNAVSIAVTNKEIGKDRRVEKKDVVNERRSK